MSGRPLGHPRRPPIGQITLALALSIVTLLAGLTVVRPALPGTAPISIAGDRGGTVTVAPAYVPLPGTVDLGPLAASAPVDVAVGLASPDPGAIDAAVSLAYTSGTPQFGTRLTPEEVAQRFAPTNESYAQAVAYFADRGLSVRTSPDRWLLEVSGSSSAVGAAFSTQFEAFKTGDRTFYSHTTPARLPAGTPWAGVFGLGNATPMRPFVDGGARAPVPAASCTFSGSLVPCAVAAAYNYSAYWTAGTNGTGQRIAVVDVYDAAEAQNSLASDFSSFTSAFSLPLGSVHYAYPVPTTRDLNATFTGWGSESALDLQWARGTAPGASLYMTLAPDATTGLYASVDWLVANHVVDVISLSWGEPDVGAFNTYAGACSSACNASSDGSYTILHPVLAAAALEGISVFAASGDCGAAFGTNGVATSYPSSDPAVTGVGATNLNLASGPSYKSESAWSGNASGRNSPGCQNQGGSGGGYAPFTKPAWQAAPGFGSTITQRGVPDVSIVGGTPVTVFIGGSPVGLEGTSVSSPIWAGLAAIADQLHGAPLGWLNPSLYQMARDPNASKMFHDIASGSNGYPARAGWDPVTGIGSPLASALLPRLGANVGTFSPTFSDVTASPRFGPVPLTTKFTALAYGPTATIQAYDIDFGDGNASWTTSGTASHVYQIPGVYLVRSTVFMIDGNTSVSPPVVVLAGGGGTLNVSLGVNTTTPTIGARVGFTPVVTGGTGSYLFTYSFGDGTYVRWTSVSAESHVYAAVGGYCATVVAWDGGSPPNASSSLRVGIAVGGAAAPDCHQPSPLSASLSAVGNGTDVPGDLAFPVTTFGGTAPFSVRYVSDDPYVTACSCGIFSTPGSHTVTAFVNDSQIGTAVASVNVTLYPALTGSFQAGALTGPAPLVTAFSLASVAGGHGVNTSATNWSYGDGTFAAGATPSAHTYAAPGTYFVRAELTDAGNGTIQAGWAVDVLPSSSPSALAVSAGFTEGGGGSIGPLFHFDATAVGGAGPGYLYRWNFGDGYGAFGSVANMTFPPSACAAPTSCPIPVQLNVTDTTGTNTSVLLWVDPAFGLNASALTVSDALGPVSGVTPLRVQGTATVGGVPSVSVLWDFGVPPQGVGTSAAHTYLSPGNFTVIETASTPLGDRFVHDWTMAVTGIARVAPNLTVASNVTDGIGPLSVGFTASPSGGAGGPFNVTWSFGDGGTGYGLGAKHTFVGPGNFTVAVTALDAIGTPATANLSLQVYNASGVVLSLSASSPVGPGSSVNVSVGALPYCGPASPPSCGVENVPVELSLSDGSSFVVQVPPSRELVVAIVAPAVPGNYTLQGLAVGPNYTGAFSIVLLVVSASCGCADNPSGSAAAWVVPATLLAGAVVAVVVATLLGRRRRRASPSRPPSGSVAPPGG